MLALEEPTVAPSTGIHTPGTRSGAWKVSVKGSMSLMAVTFCPVSVFWVPCDRAMAWMSALAPA